MARIFQERQEKYVSNLSGLEAHRCADAGTPCPWGREEGRLPKRGCFGQHRQRNPTQGCGVSIPAKGQGENGALAEPAQPWHGQDLRLLVFSGLLRWERSLRLVLCRETFCDRAEAAACREAVRRQRGSSLPGTPLPASALQRFSCMNSNRHPSGALFHARVLPCHPSAKPYLFTAIEAAGRQAGMGRCRQAQAAATPACSGRRNLTLIPPAATKGWGSHPSSCPIPVFQGARSLPLLSPTLHRARGSWMFTPAPKPRPPHLFITESQRCLGF